MAKIESISDEQWADLVAYRAEVLAIGRSAAPCDRPAAEAVVTDFYACIKKPIPVFWWCDSPWQMQAIIRVFKKHGKVLTSLWANLGANLWANLGANLRDNKIEIEAMNFWGNLEYYWIAHYSWCRRVGIVYKSEQTALLDQWEKLARSAHFWMPYNGVCFMCERPTALQVDDAGRLHSEDGMSIKYGDGYGQFNVHGVTVPQWIIERPDTIDAAKIDAEQNAEIKRIMIDRMGVSRYLQETGAQTIHMDMVRVMQGSKDFMPRALMRDKQGRQFLVGTDGSTERVYYMQTSREAKNCEEAHMAMNGGLRDELCVAQS